MDEEVTRKIAQKNKEILLLRERLKERIYDNTLGLINANRNYIETYKVDKMMELCIDALTKPREDGTTFKRVCIFVNYKDTLHELHSRIATRLGASKISLLHGDQNKQESELACKNYNAGITPILIATIMKGGQSLSLHDAIGGMETFVIISPPTSSTQMYQVFGRHHRATVKTSTTQVIVFTKGDPIEESIRKAL
jgi:superfamily II DNA or RNA helicase